MKRNYQRESDRIMEEIRERGEIPRLLLHSCCAPCSSSVLEYLSSCFSVTVFYYNPNITDAEEYRRRAAEQERLIGELAVGHPVSFFEGDHDPERFLAMAKGLEDVPEGGERCRRCFALRLSETAIMAANGGYAYFTTTLTLSPLKDADAVNEIGEQIAAGYDGLAFFPADFKKRDGYKRSLELSAQYGLYRQDYCGCLYSKAERERAKRDRANGA